MTPKPFSKEHILEFDAMTARLSPAARGIWITIRMQLSTSKAYFLEDTIEQLGFLLRCPNDTLLTVIKEFELKSWCGFRVEWPFGNALCNGSVSPPVMRLTWEPGEQSNIALALNSVRVSKYRNNLKDKQVKRMPDHYELSDSMKQYGLKHGMTEATVTHEFERYKMHHAENEWTDKGWEILAWARWVLNWTKWDRRQIQENVW